MTKCCICYNDKLCKYTNVNCNICKNTIICNSCVLKSNSYNMLCECKYFKKCPICNTKCMGYNCKNIIKIRKNFIESHEPFY